VNLKITSTGNTEEAEQYAAVHNPVSTANKTVHKTHESNGNAFENDGLMLGTVWSHFLH
jgi:hypothetical protein